MSEFPLYVDHDRASSLLGCSVANVERAVSDAGIRSKRYGRRLYFNRAEAERAGKRSDVLLSDDGNPFDVARVTEKPPTNRNRAALSLEAAAKASGLDPAELQSRAIGRCQLGVHDGRLMIRLSDLDRLAAAGIVPRSSDAAQVDSVLAAADDRSSDPAVDRRAEEVAAQLGVPDMEPASPEDRSSDATGSQVVEAKPRKRRRIGAPRRWGTQG